MAADSLSVTDNRTGRMYEIPIADGAIRATELRKIKADEDETVEDSVSDASVVELDEFRHVVTGCVGVDLVDHHGGGSGRKGTVLRRRRGHPSQSGPGQGW